VLRRDFLCAGASAAAAAGALAVPLAAEAAAPGALRGVTKSAIGVSFELAPRAAPYPLPGRPWRDPTVLAFVPRGFRLGARRALDVVLFFHGHGATAREAIVRHELREQLVESRQNAILVVPQGPVRASDGDFGRLMAPGGVARLLGEVRALLASPAAADALGASSCVGARSIDRLVVGAHSGGYRGAAAAVSKGGLEVREAWLFDALYGEADVFERWIAAAPGRRKLVSFAIGGEPLRESLVLAAALRARGIRVLEETPGARLSRAEMVRARAIVARGSTTHGGAAVEESALRDCLVASCLRGRGSEGFFEDAGRPRAIDRRGA
jgi:hypothetical protein